MPDATPHELRNIAQVPADNLGGIEALWYARVSDLVDYDELGDLPIAQLELRPGAFWYQLVSTRGTVRYKQTPKDLGRHGESYQQKLVGTLPRHSAELAAGLEALERQQLVVLYRDFNGQVQLVGTPEQPLMWADAYDSGQDVTTRNNYDWTLAGETPRRARPYLGTWTVSSVGLGGGGITLGGGSGGEVYLRDLAGNLMATVPAGKTIVLRSGFRVAFSII